MPQCPGSASRLEAVVLALSWHVRLNTVDVLFMAEIITLTGNT